MRLRLALAVLPLLLLSSGPVRAEERPRAGGTLPIVVNLPGLR